LRAATLGSCFVLHLALFGRTLDECVFRGKNVGWSGGFKFGTIYLNISWPDSAYVDHLWLLE